MDTQLWLRKQIVSQWRPEVRVVGEKTLVAHIGFGSSRTRAPFPIVGTHAPHNEALAHVLDEYFAALRRVVIPL